MHQAHAVVGRSGRRSGREDINEAASALRDPVVNLIAAQPRVLELKARHAVNSATWQFVVEQKGDANRSFGRVRPEKEHWPFAAERKASTDECALLCGSHGADDAANEPFVIGSRRARDDQRARLLEQISVSALRLRLVAWMMARA